MAMLLIHYASIWLSLPTKVWGLSKDYLYLTRGTAALEYLTNQIPPLIGPPGCTSISFGQDWGACFDS